MCVCVCESVCMCACACSACFPPRPSRVCGGGVQERFAATLVRPIAAEEALQVVDHQPYDSLRKEFRFVVLLGG